MKTDKHRKTKQVIVLRKDLGMRKGKMVAQACHASLQAYFAAQSTNNKLSDSWYDSMNSKVVVSVDCEQSLFDLSAAASYQCIPYALVQDAALTEFNAPTFTSIALGPYWAEIIDKVTGELPLL